MTPVLDRAAWVRAHGLGYRKTRAQARRMMEGIGDFNLKPWRMCRKPASCEGINLMTLCGMPCRYILAMMASSSVLAKDHLEVVNICLCIAFVSLPRALQQALGLTQTQLQRQDFVPRGNFQRQAILRLEIDGLLPQFHNTLAGLF